MAQQRKGPVEQPARVAACEHEAGLPARAAQQQPVALGADICHIFIAQQGRELRRFAPNTRHDASPLARHRRERHLGTQQSRQARLQLGAGRSRHGSLALDEQI
ncbi:MAG: hypothetical protein OHK0039_44380 [Bacteroidia bacterium]